MTKTELARTIAEETITDMIAAVARKSPTPEKHVAAYEAHRKELVEMILATDTEDEIIYRLKGSNKFAGLRAMAQTNPKLMAAYVEIGKKIAEETE